MRFSGAVEVWGRFLICAKKKHDFFFLKTAHWYGHETKNSQLSVRI